MAALETDHNLSKYCNPGHRIIAWQASNTGFATEPENPHSRKTRVFWPPENVSTPGWRRKIAKVLRAGDLIAYRVNTRNGIRALSVSQRSNLAMTPITKEIIFLHVE
jgi:hypothetical protein